MPLKVYTYNKSEKIPEIVESNNFHSKELFLIFETTGLKPYMFDIYDDDRPQLRLLAIIQRDKSIFSHSLVKRCVVYGLGSYAPELTNEEKERAFNVALKEVTQTISKKAFIIEFRNLENAIFGYKSFHDNNYIPVYWLRVRNSLHGVKKFEQRMSSSRLRQVKIGLRNGTVIEEAKSLDEVKAFARMLQRVYSSHIRKYFPNITFFYHLYNAWNKEGKTKIFIARYKDKIIGGAVCLYSGDNAYLWFSGGMRKTYAKQYPGILAIWKALKDAQDRGYQHFEFLDAGLPFKQHGFRDFILRFGGKQSSTRRWFRFRWQWLNRILITLYS